jgi:hypothetical protein
VLRDRPIYVHRLEAALDGRLVGWRHRISPVDHDRYSARRRQGQQRLVAAIPIAIITLPMAILGRLRRDG